jgi:diguanylate cyclase (GGDEF)-like protein
VPEELVASGDDDAVLSSVLGQVAHPSVFLAKVRELYGRPDAVSRDTIEFVDGRTFERHSMPQRIDGVTVGRVWSFRDVTEQKRLEGELAHQAFHDALTGLANQALFRDRVDHALARAARVDAKVAALFLDLDNFKRVNDSFGHTAGDELLAAVASRIVECLRTSDTAARLGGDEFAVLLEDVASDAETEAVADRIIAALERSFPIGERDVFISASVGIAYPHPTSTTDQLLSEADLAMYTAKRRGKGRWEAYQDEMHRALVDRLELEADLRRGLVRGELVVHYQPIVALTSGVMTGVEALVRWDHPERGRLAPDVFIPVAEESGLVIEVGRQVLLAACRQLRAWQQAHPGPAADLTGSVNVSPQQLQEDVVVAHVREALEASGLPASSLVLELTETAMMQDTEATIATLSALKELGVKLAVDDFGTGYSSLSYLQRFPVDVLKIDRAFVATLASDGDDQGSLASTIVSLAKSLRLRAVAEGVETASQAAALTELGCELAQGYFYARPADGDTIGALLADGVGGVAPTSHAAV